MLQEDSKGPVVAKSLEGSLCVWDYDNGDNDKLNTNYIAQPIVMKLLY